MQVYNAMSHVIRQLPVDLIVPMQKGVIKGTDIIIAHCVVCGRKHIHSYAGEQRTAHRASHCSRIKGSYTIDLT